MSSAELLQEIERLTKRVEELEKTENDATPSSSLNLPVVQVNNQKAKPDNYSDGPWNEWISHFKLCAQINNWDDTQCCQQLAVSLRGRAQRIYLTLQDNEKTCFDDLVNALQSRIQPDQQRKIHKLTFNARKRKHGENIVDLATDLRQLAALAYQNKDKSLVEEELVEQFIRALDSKELRIGVSQSDPKSLDEAVKLALRLESIHLAEMKNNNTAKIKMAGDERDTAGFDMAGARDKRDTAGLNMAGAKEEDQSTPRWAKKYFDQQAELMDKMKSGKRLQGGRFIEPPPAPKRVETAEFRNKGKASATDDATIFVNCRVNGYYVKALVDTGAAVTIMHEDLLARVRNKGTEVRRATKTIVGANNTPLNIIGIAEIDILVCGNSVTHDVLICNDLAQAMLIGVDFLKPHKCVIDFEKNTLRIKREEETLSYSNERKVCRVTIAQSVVLPGNSMITIACKVENGTIQNNKSGVLEPMVRFEERYKTGILKVAATIQNGQIPVRLFNLGPKGKTIYKGSTVGEFWPLLEDKNTETENCYFIDTHIIETDKKLMKGGGLCSVATPSPVTKENMDMVKELFPIVNDSLLESEKESVYKVLARHTLIVSENKTDLGEARDVQHFINTGQHIPVKATPRRFPFHKREVVREEVESMLASDVIEPSTSPWSAPVVLVRKKDGSERFCIDYRKLNAITKKDVFPLPRCDEILESLSGAAYFTHLDLVRGYWQIKVAEQDREKTAFSAPDGHFQFKRMPFGLTNAPATFQRAMNTILAGLCWTDCVVYLDDII
ncbi:Retrovirus-related Pol poly from transposon, partial, partial [Paramuricea clavata]